MWDVHYADLHIVNTGTVLGTVYVDNVAVNTYTYSGPNGGRVIYDNAMAGETYGHQSFTVYNAIGSCLFKHWDTRYDARPEPPRVNAWRTDIQSLEENRCAAVDCDVNPNGTVTGVSFVDSTAVTTFTKTGTNRQSFTHAFPSETYGRTVYTAYTGSAFKHYKTWYHLEREPDRLGVVQVGPITYPSQQNLATWIVDINPLGTVTGTVYGEGTALATATFVGSVRKTWNVGLDVDLALNPRADTTQLMVVYNAVGAGSVMKHYATTFEVSAKPFYKTTWMINYTKIGGISQLDMARFWSYDFEAAGTATITSIWDIDGTAFSTNTCTIVGRQWSDDQGLAFPPGGRGRLFQQRLLSDVGIHVWKVTLDVLRTGVKGLARATIKGVPEPLQ